MQHCSAWGNLRPEYKAVRKPLTCRVHFHTLVLKDSDQSHKELCLSNNNVPASTDAAFFTTALDSINI